MGTNIIKDTVDSRLNPYEELANAIVAQAIADYRDLRRGVVTYIDNGNGEVTLLGADFMRKLDEQFARKAEMIQLQKKRIVEFFKSREFTIFTNLDPNYVLQKLDTEPIIYHEERRKKRGRNKKWGRPDN